MVPRQKGETHAYACHMMVPVNLSYFSNTKVTKVVLLEDFPRLAVTDIGSFMFFQSPGLAIPCKVVTLDISARKLS